MHIEFYEIDEKMCLKLFGFRKDIPLFRSLFTLTLTFRNKNGTEVWVSAFGGNDEEDERSKVIN